jgi:D-arabinose 1-dehydrogenase-like Zn-dependent alcohol dehydrogenase
LKEGERLIHGIAVYGTRQKLKPFSYIAESFKPDEVEVKIQYCGKLKELTEKLEFILRTTYESGFDFSSFLEPIKPFGVLCLVGWTPSSEPIKIPVIPLIYRQRQVVASNVTSINTSQECLEFCAKNNIKADIEKIHSIKDAEKAIDEFNSREFYYRSALKIEGEIDDELINSGA